jgi:hypothetical protein
VQRAVAFKSIFWVALILVSVLLATQSQMYAYVGDESFHLLAAKLISAGETPYAGFFYQHPPLFIYVVAGIFRIAGAGWRIVHFFSALSLIGAIVLAAGYARDLFREESMRWLNAALMPLLIGLNCYLLVFASTGLPFGFCLFCLMAALRLSRSRTKAGLFLTGIFAGAAAAASFLAIPALIVFLFWLGRRDRAKAWLFVAGVTVAFIPLLILLVVAPEATILDVFRYHLLDRPNLGWSYNVREIVAWFATLQGITLTLAAIAAIWLRKDDDVRLCGLISLVLIVSIAAARTTTGFYFLLATPFLAILAATTLTEVARGSSRYSKVIGGLLLSLYLVGLLGLRQVWRREAPYMDHRAIESVVQKLDSCAPRGEFYAPEAVYFADRRLPPRGMENRFDPFFRGDQLLAEGRLEAVVIGSTDPRVERFDLVNRYARSELVDFDGYSLRIFCDRIRL